MYRGGLRAGDLQAGLPGRNLAVATLESSISVAGHEVRPLAELLQCLGSTVRARG